MSKSPWVIFIIGVIGIVMLVVLGKTYLGQDLRLQIKTELAQKFGVEDIAVERNEQTGEIIISYQANEAAFGNDKAVLNQQMEEWAEFAYKRFKVAKLRIVANSAESDQTHTRIFTRD